MSETVNGGGDVLVVEDDPDINELVGAYVEMAGFKYRPALDGQTGLNQAAAKPPAIVVLDLMLPDIDGLQVCRTLKASPQLAGVPVIILTAIDKESTRAECMQCGAAEFMTKPFDPDQLMAVIARYAGAP